MGAALEETAVMKRVIVAGVFFLANVVGPAMAQGCGSHGGTMTSTQISALIDPGGTFPSTVYTCYNNGTVRESNEWLYGKGPNGAVWDYKKGPSDPKDPSGPVGTFTGSSLTVGTITYTYPSGSFTYNICVTPSGSVYQWVNTSTGTNLSIYVGTSNSGC
jgi:hypothetical protein